MFLLYGIWPARALSRVVLPAGWAAAPQGSPAGRRAKRIPGFAHCRAPGNAASAGKARTWQASSPAGRHRSTGRCCGLRTTLPSAPLPDGPMIAVRDPGLALPATPFSNSRFWLKAAGEVMRGGSSGESRGHGGRPVCVVGSAHAAPWRTRPDQAAGLPAHPVFLSVRVQVRSRHSSRTSCEADAARLPPLLAERCRRRRCRSAPRPYSIMIREQ